MGSVQLKRLSNGQPSFGTSSGLKGVKSSGGVNGAWIRDRSGATRSR